MRPANKSRFGSWSVAHWYDRLAAVLQSSQSSLAKKCSRAKVTLAVMELESRLVPSTVVYQRDFEPNTSPQLAPGVTASWSQTGKTTTPTGRTFLGEFGNQTVTLTLNGLPTHDAVTIGFDLYLLKTWDGSDSGTGAWGPDHWSMAAGGTQLFDATFANRTDANSGHTNATQSFGGQDQPLGAYDGFTGAAEHGTLGYTIWRADFNRYEDMSAVYHLEFAVTATSATQTFSFTGSGLQGISDESWGLDNVQVSTIDRPAYLIPSDSAPGCNPNVQPGNLVQVAAGLTGNVPVDTSSHPVRYADGSVRLAAADLASDDAGQGWGLTRSWTNTVGYPSQGILGTGWLMTELPSMLQVDGGDTLIILSNGSSASYFDLVAGTYQPRAFFQETLTHDTANHLYVLTDTTGKQIRFYDFDTTWPATQRGQFASRTDTAGTVTAVVAHTTDGKIAEIQSTPASSSAGRPESYVYTYGTSGAAAGLLQSVAMRQQQSDSTWQTVRQVAYSYYDGVEAYGNAGDLKTAIIKDGAGTQLDADYYRYYVAGEVNGYTHALKYVFNQAAYARLLHDYSDPAQATNAQVAPYADNYFEYDALHRVSKETAQGAGCSVCTGGQGTFTFNYTTSTFANGYNSWHTRTVETLPDGNQNIVYTNVYGEVMLTVFHDTSTDQEWATFYQYDDQGRLLVKANPSAVSGYDDQFADLLHNQSGNYQYLQDAAGLLTLYSYYTATTATDSAAGGVAGYQHTVSLQQGELGTAIPQNEVQYITHTSGSDTIYLPASTTVYRNSDGTGEQTTQYSYTFFTGTLQVASLTTTYPTISTAQHGSGNSDQQVVVYDQAGRPIWVKDAAGYLHYTAYDPATGATIKTITDVDTSRTSDFTDLPAGWSTPTGGGLHLVTTMEVDNLGRTTKLTDPNGNITYTTYNDPAQEVRVYAGWDSTTHRPIGPTAVYRQDLDLGYTEMLTMSATPAVDGNGRPTGTESISGLLTLARDYTNTAGQVISRDAYFDLSGLTYTTATNLGTEGTNFYRTRLTYDDRGRPNKVVSPTGTISRTVYDGLGRPVSEWVGTNDTPSSGYWSPDNPAGMVKVRDYIYDDGAVGDGNLTRMIEYPGGGAEPRVTDYAYDWRDRLVAVKQGVQTTEAADLNRPIFYYELDNLGQNIAVERYDGDGVTLTDANSDGVPDKPSASLRRARSTTDFDDLGRVYRTSTYSVDPATGSISANALTTDMWYDQRGQLIKTAAPGGLVSKQSYDGAGRLTVSYTSDGGGDSSWADAFNVTGDTVLEQTETQYDASSNAIQVTTRQRFHDATGTGALGDPSSGIGARVSYAGMYYDALNRLTATVNVGTNGGSSWTRPSTVPARSDAVLVSSYSYTAAGWLQDTTDPFGLVMHSDYDNLGRTTRTIEAYSDGVPTNGTNKTTEFTYDGSNHLLTLTAVLPGSGVQTTQYVYGVTTAGGSGIDSNDILAAVQYPDPTTGSPSSSQQESYTVNALGETLTKTDRNSTVHSYSYDVLGRLTADAVTTLGTGVDGAIRRLETAYDGQGNPYLLTSYNAASGGSIVNQVQRDFNGLGQLITEYQSHAGAVNTATTPKVQYVYSEMAGGANHSRLTSLIYPDGREVDYNYSSGLDDSLSRLSSLSDNSGTLESYDYLGLGTVVRRAHPETGVDLTYIKQTGESNGDAGDQYTGLDRFGRVVDQRWLNTSSGLATDDFQYGYDRDSNVLYRNNVVDAVFSELYAYDNLNQLTGFVRGTLSDSNSDGILDTVSSPSQSQSWNLDALGNWSGVTTDGTTEDRTHNAQNEITAVDGTNLSYDANGNLTTDEAGNQLIYDAWNRLVQVKDSSSVTLAGYNYDALNRRVTETHGTSRELYYSANWQVVEERESGLVVVQNVWSPVYVDALLLRDRDTNGDGTLDERLYAQQDANWNVTALVNTSGVVVERNAYTPYGMVTVLDASWVVRSSSAYDWIYLRQGTRRDLTTNQDDSRGRIYDVALGRPLQTDPLSYGAGDTNLYRWESNAPLGLLDPSGLDWADWVAWGLDRASFGLSTQVLVSPTFGNALDQSDRVFAGWSHSLTGGLSTGARARLYGETATRNHQGTAFEIGRGIGHVHNAALAVGGAYQGAQGLAQLANGGRAALTAEGGLLLAGEGGLVPALATTAEGTVVAGYGIGISYMSNQNQGSGGGSCNGGNAPQNPSRNIAEHLVRDHPERFGRDLPRIQREVQNVIDNATHSHTVQHGPTAGSQFFHRSGKTVMVRPNGEGTMVADPNGNTFRNWVALEP